MEADTCEGCGLPISEAWTAEADPNNFAGSHFYEAPPPTRCHACTALAIQQDVKSGEGTARAHPTALHYGVIRRDRRR